jgi:hypothetical protein
VGTPLSVLFCPLPATKIGVLKEIALRWEPGNTLLQHDEILSLAA